MLGKGDINETAAGIEYLEKHFGSLMPVSDHLICQKNRQIYIKSSISAKAHYYEDKY